MNKVILLGTATAMLATAPFAAANGPIDGKLYGKVNVSVVNSDSGSEDTWKLNSNASRIGLKGSTQVSEGLTVFYKTEFQVDVDGDGYSLQQRVTDVLEEVGLEADFQDRYPHEFSGGQRQRIAIARALILRPEVIIFDEPTSALDVTVQKQIIELLLNLQQRHGLSYIFISHDISLIGTVCHTMFVMKDGEIVEMGSVQKILDTPSDAYTQTLINAANRK